jgi:hypothetical protein
MAKKLTDAESVGTKVAEGRSALETVRAHTQLTVEAAEALLLRWAEGHEPSASEKSIFAALGWSRQKIDDERRRTAQVVRLREFATPAKLADAEKRRAAAKVRMEKERPALVAQIETLQAEAAAIETQHAAAERDVIAIEQGKRQLLACAPSTLRENADRAKAVLNQAPDYRRMLTLEIEIASYKTLRDVSDLPSRQMHIHARTLSNDPDVQMFDPGREPHKWDAYVAMRERQMPTMQAECDELRRKFDELKAQNEVGLSVYWTD